MRGKTSLRQKGLGRKEGRREKEKKRLQNQNRNPGMGEAAAAGSHGYKLCSQGRVAAGPSESLFYKVTENCRERMQPGQSNASVLCPTAFHKAS